MTNCVIFWAAKISFLRATGLSLFTLNCNALLETTDNWTFNIDRGNVSALVFLDLKKAFDTVDQDVLLSKMNL